MVAVKSDFQPRVSPLTVAAVLALAAASTVATEGKFHFSAPNEKPDDFPDYALIGKATLNEYPFRFNLSDARVTVESPEVQWSEWVRKLGDRQAPRRLSNRVMLTWRDLREALPALPLPIGSIDPMGSFVHLLWEHGGEQVLVDVHQDEPTEWLYRVVGDRTSVRHGVLDESREQLLQQLARTIRS